MSAARPWYRLHRSTYCVLIFLAAALTLMIVPRDRDRLPVGNWGFFEPDGEFRRLASGETNFQNLHYGWPRRYCHAQWNGVFVLRDYSYLLVCGDEVPWRNALNWPLPWNWRDQNVRNMHWDWFALSLDVAFALGILMALATGFETWRRRRFQFWQFRISEMMFLVLVLGCVAWWWRGHQQEGVIEERWCTSPQAEGLGEFRDYEGPAWLARLVGIKNLSACIHITKIRVPAPEPTSVQLPAAKLAESIKPLPYVRRIEVICDDRFLTRLADLNELPEFQELAFVGISLPEAARASLAELRNLELLELYETGLSAAEVAALRASLPNTTINIVVDRPNWCR